MAQKAGPKTTAGQTALRPLRFPFSLFSSFHFAATLEKGPPVAGRLLRAGRAQPALCITCPGQGGAKRPWGQSPLASGLSLQRPPFLLQALERDGMAACGIPEAMDWESYGYSGQVLPPQPAGCTGTGEGLVFQEQPAGSLPEVSRSSPRHGRWGIAAQGAGAAQPSGACCLSPSPRLWAQVCPGSLRHSPGQGEDKRPWCQSLLPL